MVEPRMARTSPIVKANKEVVGRKVVSRNAILYSVSSRMRMYVNRDFVAQDCWFW